MIYDWTNFHLNELQEDDYGINWPVGTSQLAKELVCFRTCIRKKKYKGMKTAFIHAIRIIRRLWPDEIDIYKETKWGRIYNTYFLDVLKTCCTFKHVGFTGPASSAKTFTVSVYNLLMFYCNPQKTLGMLSTTSGQASERRIWADIKSLHRSARFDREGIERVGEIVDYLKCLTFDFEKTLDSTKNNQRDLRNALQVIPIPAGSGGDEAVNTIMGSKNEYVLWSIDELPAMNDSVLRPCANLESNPFFQSAIIGNAQLKSDPHGVACEPEDGWSSISGNDSCRWKAKDGRTIIFLHGEKGPNDDPRINQLEIKSKADYPFPYLANKITRDAVALSTGRGDLILGRQTIDYIRFQIGFWAGDDAQNTVLTEAFVKRFKADQPPDPWSPDHRRSWMALDPAFTSGGDANSISYAEYGKTIYNEPQIVFCTDSIEIRPIASERDEYNKLVAEQVVKEAKDKKVHPSDFGIDISNDAGTTLQSIQDEWRLRGQITISSNEKSSNPRYDTRVTELWFSVQDLIGSGCCRGFNLNSKYFKDLSQRRYVSLNSDCVAVEKKKDMKKRIRRSPDNGDSFAYLCFLIVKAGVVKLFSQKLKEETGVDSSTNINYNKPDFHSNEYQEFGEYSTGHLEDSDYN